MKGVAYLVLSGAAHAEIRIRCTNAPGLCQAPVPATAVVHVWLQNVGLAGHWVVAAEYKGKTVASPESQNSLYRIAKIFWGLGALLSSALVVMSLYFAPSNPGPALVRGSLKG